MDAPGSPLVWHDDVMPDTVRSSPAPTPAASVSPASTPTLTPETAEARIAALRADKKGPLYNAAHPRHQAALDELMALRRIVTGAENHTLVTLPERGDSAQMPVSAPLEIANKDLTWSDEKLAPAEAVAQREGEDAQQSLRALKKYAADHSNDPVPTQEEAEQELRVLWGSAYETNIQEANRLTGLLSEADAARLLYGEDGTPALGNHVGLIKLVFAEAQKLFDPRTDKGRARRLRGVRAQTTK